jgi:hypothetical protein
MIPANKQLSAAAIWGFLQLALLGIGASGFPLWSHHPLPRESLALPVLLVGQAIFLALLFAVITPTISSLEIGLFLMLPMDELAGMFSNSPQGIIFKAFIGVGVWMTGLAGLGWLLRDPRQQLAVSAMAALLTAGGAILDYLRWEASTLPGHSGIFSPITLLPKLIRSDNGADWPWLQCSLPAIAAVMLMALFRIVQRAPIPSSTLLHHLKKDHKS